MKAVFLAGHTALDFLNTRYEPPGGPVEVIGDGRSFLNWLVEAKLLSPAEAASQRRAGPGILDDAAAEARRVREWARAWLVRWREKPDLGYRREVAALNKLLARGSYFHELGVDGAVVRRM